MKKYIYFCFLILLTDLTTAQEDKYPENFGEIFKSDKMLLGQNIFKGDIAYSLSRVSYVDETQILQEYLRQSIRFNFNINPWQELYIRTSIYLDLTRSSVSPPWLSDFFYQVGYYNWRSNSVSFGYENYQPNRWATFFENFYENFKRGFVFVSYNITLEKPEGEKTLKPFFWDETSKLIIVPVFKVHPEYQDENNNFAGYFKPILGVNIRYVIFYNIYLESGLFYYSKEEAKLSWDPDFTYGFGIFDWRAFKINISYGNWIANRFPWNEGNKELDYYGFLNGEFVLSFTYSW